jgi:hypothetical protein
VSSGLGMDVGLKALTLKNKPVTNHSHKPGILKDYLDKRPKGQNVNIIFGVHIINICMGQVR